jgi:FMN phosphatase YigB (HAD superfamily)
MIKCVIFDFNRTIYLPDLKKIPKRNIELLYDLKKKGLLLGLISVKESGRENIINSYNLFSFFSFLRLVDCKNLSVFREALSFFRCLPCEVIVVGDRIKSEIRIANKLGIYSVWYRQGKFKDEVGVGKDEVADKIIFDLLEVLEVVKSLNQ